MTATDLKKRAIALAEKTKIDSVTPEEVGQLSNDIVEYIENVEINGSSLGIRKTYTSVSAMEADSTAPKDDKGVLLRRGMLVNIYNQSDPDSADNGKVFSFQNPGWAFRGTVDAGYATKEELTELSDNVGLYNVDKNVPIGSGFYNSTTARAAVPSSVRKLGLIITYKTDATTSVTEQFIGSAVSGWAADSNWRNVGSEGGNKILQWHTDVATTRKQVPSKERKSLLQISYKNENGEIINEQYIGTLLTDTEWAKDANWERMATNKGVVVPNVLSIKPSDMSPGILSRTDGTLSDSTTYIASDFIEIPKTTSKITFTVKNASGGPCVCFYSDKDESTFINYKTGSSTGTSVTWGDAKYFRFCFSNYNTDSSGAGVTVDYTKIPAEEFENVYTEISNTNKNVAEVNVDLQDYKNEILVEEIYNYLVIKSGGEQGKVNTTDGSVDTESTANGVISKFYDITNVVRIIIHCPDTTARQSYLFLYNSDKVLIENYSRTHNSSNDIDVVPPSNAKYMKWGFWQHSGDFIMYKRNLDYYIGNSKTVRDDILEGFSLYPQKIYPTLLKTALSLSTSGKVTVPERDEQFITTALDSSSYIDLLGVEKMDAYLSLASSAAAFAFLDESKDTIKVYKKTDGELIPDNAECYKFENVEIPWNARYVAFNANRTGEYKYIVLYKRSVDKPKVLGGRSPIFIKYEVDGGFDDFEDTEKSTQEQNPQVLGTDEAIISLPNEYTADGAPSKLILYCHGASDTAISPSSTPPSIDGFAVVQFTGSPSNLRNEDYCETGTSMGNWQFIRCAVSVYRYCCENFNIDRRNIYVLGTSLGGLCALNIAMSGCLPVRAVGLDAPVIDLYHDAYFNGNWFDSLNGVSTPVMVAWCYNWNGINWENGTYNNGETDKPLSELKTNGNDMVYLWNLNKNKMIGFNAYRTGDFLIKNLDDSYKYETDADNSSATLTDNEDEYFGKKMPCPVKIWMASIDSINQINIAKRFFNKCRNGGTVAVFRTVTAAIHGVIGYDYVKKEMSNWFKRW